MAFFDFQGSSPFKQHPGIIKITSKIQGLLSILDNIANIAVTITTRLDARLALFLPVPRLHPLSHLGLEVCIGDWTRALAAEEGHSLAVVGQTHEMLILLLVIEEFKHHAGSVRRPVSIVCSKGRE